MSLSEICPWSPKDRTPLMTPNPILYIFLLAKFKNQFYFCYSWLNVVINFLDGSNCRSTFDENVTLLPSDKHFLGLLLKHLSLLEFISTPVNALSPPHPHTTCPPASPCDHGSSTSSSDVHRHDEPKNGLSPTLPSYATLPPTLLPTTYLSFWPRYT